MIIFYICITFWNAVSSKARILLLYHDKTDVLTIYHSKVLGDLSMGIQKYRAFLKVVDTGSVTRAAEELGYTQSAVSRMLKELEKEWGIHLVHRYRSGAVITSEGIAILPHVREMLAAYDNIFATAAEIKGLRAGTLRIGSFTSLSTNLLPLILRAFRNEHPQIQIELLNGEYNEVADWLRTNRVDCGFLSMPVEADLDATLFFRDQLVAIVPLGSPYADRRRFHLDDLASENMVMLKEEQDDEINVFLESHNVKVRTVYEVSNDYSILTMVEMGMGVSVVHDLILHPPRYQVKRLTLDVRRPIDIGIAVKKNSTPSTLTKLFMEFALSHVDTIAKRAKGSRQTALDL